MASKPVIQGPRVSIPFNRGGGVLFEGESPAIPTLNNLYFTEYLFGLPFARPLTEFIYFSNTIDGGNLRQFIDEPITMHDSLVYVNTDRGLNIQSYLEYITMNCNYITLVNSNSGTNIQSYIEFLHPVFIDVYYFTNSSTDNNMQSNLDSHVNPFHLADSITFRNT